MKTWLQTEAVKDAARRAREAAAAAGARLGAVKVIDPTARACETDVLAGWPSYGGGPGPHGRRRRGVASGSPRPRRHRRRRRRAAGQASIQVVLQPPMQLLTAQACVVYGVSG